MNTDNKLCKRCKEEKTDGWTYCEGCSNDIYEEGGIDPEALTYMFESQGE